MREIKAKGWNKKTQSWIYVYIGQLMTNEGMKIYGEMCLNGVEWLQYTGLKDKHGKEIYEGDVIKQGVEESKFGWFAPRIVEFKNGAWMGGKIRIFVEQDKADYQGQVSNNKWEIIGNIYENPELKGGE